MAGTFALRASSNMFSTNLPLVARELFDFSDALVGILTGIVALAGFISLTFVNARLRSVWRRRLFIASAFIYGAVFSFIPLGGYFGVWFLSITAGFFLQLISTNQTNASGILGKTGSGRERVITLYTVILSASLVVGPLINSAILAHVSLDFSFAAFAFFPVGAAVLSLLIPVPRESSTVVPNEVAEKANQEVKPVGSFRHTWRNRGFQAAVFIYAMYGIPFAALVSFGGLFSHEYYNASNASVQLYFVIFFGISFLFRAIMLFAKKINIRAMILASIFLTLLGVMMLVTIINPISYAIALAVLGIPHGLTFPTSLIVISRSSDESRRNALNSYFGSSYAMISVLTPLLMGLLADQFGLRYAFGALVISIAVFSYLILRKWDAIED